jgi:4-amino-4-deoxy-L-arabinose transferase-like glycosyltransferase
MLVRKIPRRLWLVLPMAYFLYFFRLGSVGVLGPDEPRYAAIGQAMARSGDWITPRLWGEAWFEKPALTYWMTAAGFRLGLGTELAPRLPVALLSVAFLIFFYWIVKREFGGFTAGAATMILGTSVAWVGFSQVGVTDLPLTAAFSAAMLLALPWIGKRDGRYLAAAGASLGLAVLAKGLLPLVLAAPLAQRLRWFRDLLQPWVVAPLLAIALPWYVLCYARNGAVFLHEFFVVHHLERFTTGGLQHVQPWWFYLPMVPALLLPWAPLLPAVVQGREWREPRRLFLLLWAGFGLIFFSASTNKLPGYLVPLLPAMAILMALGLERGRGESGPRAGSIRPLLAVCALLLAVYVVAGPLLPAAIANEWASAPRMAFHWTWMLPLLPAGAVWMLDARGKRLAAVAVIAVGAVAGVAFLKITAEPSIDRTATARDLGREVARHPQAVCLEGIRREWQYGLNYYAGTSLPDCRTAAKPFRVVEKQGFSPRLTGPWK